MLTFPVVLISCLGKVDKEPFLKLQEMSGVGFPENVQLNVAVFWYSTSCLRSGERVTLGATTKLNKINILLRVIKETQTVPV